jgi:hypothetical protein
LTRTNVQNFVPSVVVVFVCGGGTYIEHELISELGREMWRDYKIQLVYGCDRVICPQKFLAEQF